LNALDIKEKAMVGLHQKGRTVMNVWCIYYS
jgi:hypothetical protein